VLKVIKENPGRKWSNAEVVQALPAAKRANAKQYVYALLSTLNRDGVIQRIAPGIYVCQEHKDAVEEA
jgi:predicted transcriptional regulator of viral defense system